MQGVVLEFSQFGDFDSFDVFRSNSSMENTPEVDLPTPISTGLTTMFFNDVSVIEGEKYFYKVRVWRDGESLLSNEISIIAAMANEMFGGVEETIVIGEFTYKIHTFTESGVLVVNTYNLPVDVLLVGGGGGGGVFGGGGGGGGGVLAAYEVQLEQGGEYLITVGAGAAEKTGNGKGNNGGDSKIITPAGVEVAKATGGEGGYSGSGGQRGGNSGAGYLKGSLVQAARLGGGANSQGTQNGGAGAGGVFNGRGGIGLQASGFGVDGFLYGAGGGSGPNSAGSLGYRGGLTGGGNGRPSSGVGTSTSGLPNSGGGGGGAWGGYAGTNGGGSGLIKIRYKI